MDTCSKEKSKTEGLMDGKFNMFMETVDERFRSFVSQINEYLTGNGCTLILKFFLAIPAQKREESSIPPAVYVGFNRL